MIIIQINKYYKKQNNIKIYRNFIDMYLIIYLKYKKVI
jgi:hypothetical protein